MLYQFEYKEIKNCYGCPLLYHDDIMGPVGCLIHEDNRDPQFFDETKPDWCPLVEVNDININAVDVTKNDTSISEEIDDLDNININYIKFYKDYPDFFVEEFLGLELYPYQKVILRHIVRHSKNKLKL